MAKTIPQYRQEKYDKYDSIDEGKLFYRHEKNLDLVNTVEEIVYILQEENPWMNPPIKREMLGIAYNFPNPIRSQIYKKIERSYNNGIKGSLRNADYRLQKLVLKPLIYKNNPKELLWRELGYVILDIQRHISDDIHCFSHGGVSAFFFGERDWLKLMYIVNKGQKSEGMRYNNKVMFLPKESIRELEDTFNHEYQHYLFNTYFSIQPHERDIHRKIINEICAVLTDKSYKNPEQTKKHMKSYITDFCSIDGLTVHIDKGITVKGVVDNKMVDDPKIQRDIDIFIVLTPLYVEMAHALIDFFQDNPKFQIDRQKTIRLLSMTSPHYRKDLLKYYTKLAQHMKEKSMTSSEQ